MVDCSVVCYETSALKGPFLSAQFLNRLYKNGSESESLTMFWLCSYAIELLIVNHFVKCL